MASFSGSTRVRSLRSVRSVFGLGLALLAFSSVRCSLESDAVTPADDPGDGDAPGMRDEWPLVLTTSFGGGAGFNEPHALCNWSPGECVPDDQFACSGLGGAGGASGELEALGGQGGGVTFDPGDLVGSGYGCQLQVDAECEGESCTAEPTCVPSGPSGEGEPCVSASDCSAGLACVGEGVSGICRSYCCLGTERSCQSGTFCDVRSTPDEGSFVPVCVPVDDCPLTDPFPCPDGEECACQEDRGCVVVRADGATACAKPGPGREGDPCTATRTADCAHGFVCSPSAGCMKLCDRGVASQGPEFEEMECPGGGTCAPPPEFPDGLGVCVGTDDDSKAAAR